MKAGKNTLETGKKSGTILYGIMEQHYENMPIQIYWKF